MRKAPRFYGALTRTAVRHSAGHARLTVVLGCAAALIMAGRVLPF